MTIQDASDMLIDAPVHTYSRTTWADLGCGDGVFTLALASHLSLGSTIHALDKKKHRFDNHDKINIVFHQLDFVQDDLPVSQLDGIIMANSLHYVKDKIKFLNEIAVSLKPDGIFIIVEYETDRKNLWVPYPIKFDELSTCFSQIGFQQAKKISTRPSIYGHNEIYAAYVLK